MMKSGRWKIWILLGVFFPVLYYLNYEVVRADFPELAGCYIILFGLMGAIWYLGREWKDDKPILIAGILARAMLLFSIPNLSDDFYRFLWDGGLIAEGLNPYLSKPENLAGSTELTAGQNELFQKMNSRQYYTVYPPVLQAWFWVSATVGGTLGKGVFILKLGIVLAETGTMLLLKKLQRVIRLSKNALWLYILNPFVITELAGNIHFEAFMIFFVLLAIWQLHKGRWWAGAIFFVFSVMAKLLPLMLLPFLIKRLGWKKFFLFSGVCTLLGVLMFLPFYHQDLVAGPSKSLGHYYDHFEFNASLYYLFTAIFRSVKRSAIGIILVGMAGATILLGAGLDRNKQFEKLAGRFLFVLMAYYVCATTVHPWYLTGLVAMSVLTRFRFPVLWGVLICFSYLTYSFDPPMENMWLIRGEYLLLFVFLIYELLYKSPTFDEQAYRHPLLRRLLKKSLPARMKIKLGRILPYLEEGDRILDVGVGNGALGHTLMTEGYDIKCIDIKRLSLFENYQPQIYDGNKFPFPDRSRDVALLITMLHHTPEPELILHEAKRVASRVIVMEDVYRNSLQKWVTFFTDSLVNLEFAGHPHTNRTHEEWMETFRKMGFTVRSWESERTLLFFRQNTYILEAA